MGATLMSWFKVDDKLHSHPKRHRAGLRAMGLWVVAGSWCADHLMDGIIPEDITVDHVVPRRPRRHRRAVQPRRRLHRLQRGQVEHRPRRGDRRAGGRRRGPMGPRPKSIYDQGV